MELMKQDHRSGLEEAREDRQTLAKKLAKVCEERDRLQDQLNSVADDDSPIVAKVNCDYCCYVVSMV